MLGNEMDSSCENDLRQILETNESERINIIFSIHSYSIRRLLED